MWRSLPSMKALSGLSESIISKPSEIPDISGGNMGIHLEWNRAMREPAMLKRPTLSRDKRVERQLASDDSELDKGLDAVIKRSSKALENRINSILQPAYKDRIDQTEHSA
jgi:hypothetical protein